MKKVFKVGDIVGLKTGSDLMRIEVIMATQSNTTCICSWANSSPNDKNRESMSYDEDELMHVE